MTGVYPVKPKYVSYGSTESIKASLVKDLGFEQGNSVQTPAQHDVTEEDPETFVKFNTAETARRVPRYLLSVKIEPISHSSCTSVSKDVSPTKQGLAKL